MNFELATNFFGKPFNMARGMSIMQQWVAAGRDIRSNGLAEGHNGAELSGNPYFQLRRPGLSSKLPFRGENEIVMRGSVVDHVVRQFHKDL